jgi:outer membrane protein TolC
MDAVTQAVAQTPEVALAREGLAYKHAQVQIDQGEQDIRLSTGISYDETEMPLTPYSQGIYEKSAEDTQTFLTRFGAEKTLNSGVTLNTSVGLTHARDSVLDSPPDNYARVYFQASLPLRKLWSTGVLGKREKNSEIDLRAGFMDLAATVAGSAESAALAFWDALAARAVLRTCRDQEAAMGEFLEAMTALVAKGEYPAAHLDRIRAAADAKAVRRITAEQAYYAALQALALQMGTEATGLRALPEVSGEFPAMDRVAVDPEALLGYALDQRPELAAEKLREAYNQELVADARTEMLPEVDLNVGAGYHGLEETSDAGGYFRSLGENVPGPSYSVALMFSRPLGNNVGAGKWRQARAVLNQGKIRLQRLQSVIASEVLTAHQALLNSLEALDHQADAAARYRIALEKETIRFRRRMGNLSDHLDAEDDYHDSLNDLAARQNACAAALVRLRRATGSLVTRSGPHFAVDAARFVSTAGLAHLGQTHTHGE